MSVPPVTCHAAERNTLAERHWAWRAGIGEGLEWSLTDPRSGRVVLATCERFEVWTVGPSVSAPPGWVRRGRDHAAITHLFRLASGLDSRIPGEPHILGQVRDALTDPRNRVTPPLGRLFQGALRVGRHIRRVAGLDRLQESYVTVTVDHLAATRDSAGAPVGIVGGGAMARDLVKELTRRGEGPVVVLARHPARAAGRFGALPAECDIRPLTDLEDLVPTLEALVLATSASHPVLDLVTVPHRPTRLTVIDLGMPPNLAWATPSPPWVEVWRLEDLGRGADLAPRILRQAELSVTAEVRRFVERYRVAARHTQHTGETWT